jgi:hypothetical protein
VALTEGEGEQVPETVPLGLRVPEALDDAQPEAEGEGVAAEEAEKEPVGERVTVEELLAVGEREAVAVARVGIFTVHTCMESASWGVVPPPPADGSGGAVVVPYTVQKRAGGRVTLFSLPYSEHSSWGELREAVAGLAWHPSTRVVPTVNARSAEAAERMVDALRA